MLLRQEDSVQLNLLLNKCLKKKQKQKHEMWCYCHLTFQVGTYGTCKLENNTETWNRSWTTLSEKGKTTTANQPVLEK